MIRTRFLVAATMVALGAGCAGTPTTTTAPVPDRQIAATAPTVKFTAADIEQMRKMLPTTLTPDQASKLVIVDPSKVKQPDRTTQVFRFHRFGRIFGFWPFTYAGLSLYWPYTYYGGLWSIYGVWPYATWAGLWWPYGLGWGALWW